MADARISELPALAKGDAAANDILPIVDIGASITKKISIKDLFEAGSFLASNGTIDLGRLDQSSITKLGTSAIAANAITYAKLQNTTGTDKLLGRSSEGAGTVEEITCTAAGRALLDDLDASAQRTTLGLGTLATQSSSAVSISGGTITGTTIAGITDLAIADGGTGASNAADARTNLGLAIGSNVQAYDAGLASIAGLTTSADQLLFTTAADTYATASLTAAGRALLDDLDAAAQRTTLGLGSIATQSSSAVAITGGTASFSTLTAASATISAGTITGITDLAVADGGTGASTASGARTNLGLAIGTDVQAYDPALASIASLTTSADQLLFTTAADTFATASLTPAGRTLLAASDAAGQRTALGLGTLATQSAGAVAITGGTATLSNLSATSATISGGSITGITDLAIADGGTGASTAATARTNLGLEIGTDVQAYSAALASIAGLTTSGGQYIYTTAANTYATGAITAAGRTLLAGADAVAQRSALGLGGLATQSPSTVAITGGTISGLTSLAADAATFGSATISAGTITGITDLAVADGGTGASTASAARTNLGLVIGTDVQAYSAALASISGLNTSANQLIYTTDTATYATSPLTAAGRALLDDADAAAQRTTLGLGTLATQSGTFSGTHSGTSSGTNTGDQTIVLSGVITGSGTGPITTAFGTGVITESALATNAVTTAKVAAASLTGPKFAANSTVIVQGNTPSGDGDYEGQSWLNTNTSIAYTWTGTTWQRHAGIASITFTESTPFAFAVSYADAYSATVTTTLDTQQANRVWAGPTSGVDATPTFRALTPADLPNATSTTKGIVQPGSGLLVNAGVLDHTNSVTAGEYTKVTVDAQGHVSAGSTLTAADIPSLDTAKITTGTFATARLADNSVTAAKLADYATAQIGDTIPTADYIGQIYLNPLDKAFFLWDGNVWQPIGITAGSVVFAGTYNATTNTIASVTSEGSAIGLTVGNALPAASATNQSYYVVVSIGGTGVAPAPAVTLAPPDLILSNGANWIEIDVSSTYTSQTAANVGFTPAANIGSTTVQAAIEEVSNECRNASNLTSGTLAVARGGTGVVSYAKGDLLVASAATTLNNLTAGTNGQVLRVNNATATGLQWGDDFVGTVTSVTGTAPIQVATGTTTPVISVTAATTSAAGVVQLTNSTSTTSSTLAATATAVKSAYDLAAAALPSSGGTITGALTLGNTASLVFEGVTDDSYEVTLAVADPASDVTVTLPAVTGTVALTSQLDDGTY